MARTFTKSDIHPEQVLLLKAALFPASEALSYWQIWKKARRLDQFVVTSETLLPSIFDPLDVDSQRLMPMVYRNLEKSDDPLIPHLRGIYRYTWLSNQRFLAKMKQVIGALQQASIDTIVLKGIPLSLQYYGDMGVRMMNDLDVMIPTAQAEQALRVLKQAPTALNSSQFEYKHRHILHAMHLWDTQKVDVDLHWHLLIQHTYPEADTPFWVARQPITLASDLQTHTLSPTHQLFHNLVHGFSWAQGCAPIIRWIADSYVIYTKPDVLVDWHDLLNLAERYQVRYPIRQALRLLQAEFRLTLPVDVRERLEQMVLNPTEKAYFALVQKKSSNNVSKAIHYIQRHRLAYQLFRKGKSGPSLNRWMYNQLRFRIDWPNRDLPF